MPQLLHIPEDGKNLYSLAPGKFEWNFGCVIFKQILLIYDWGTSCEFALIWMSLDFTDDQSTLVQVMAWCRQSTSHYLIQCWPRSLLPYGKNEPEWVNLLWLSVVKWFCFLFNTLWPNDIIWCCRSGSTLDQVMAYHLFGAKPLPEPILTYCQQFEP